MLKVSEALYRIGDKVRLKDSCHPDIGMFAWEYIIKQRIGVVKAVFKADLGNDRIYAVEFPDEFEGGHNCQRTVLPHRGQFVTECHLDLDDFEGSRGSQEIRTVPNIGGYDDGYEDYNLTQVEGSSNDPRASVSPYPATVTPT